MPANEAIIIELKLAGATAFQAQARTASGSISDIGDTSRKAEKPTGKFGKVVGGLAPLAAGAAVGGGALAATFGVKAVGAFRESYKVGRQTGAVIKSTGGAANVTAEQVAGLATSISKKTGIDDEAIQSGQNMLLTFSRVRNETGKGNDVFNRATSTLTDMSTALGSDPKTAAMQLGKALNDPVKGITALRRVGVAFDDNQQKRIERFVKEGKTVKAQRMILRELNKEFGGSAKAQATNADRLKVAFGNLQENVGGLLAPAVEKVSGWLLKLGPLFSKGGGGAKFLQSALKALSPIFSAAAGLGRAFAFALQPIIQNAHYLVPVLRVLGKIVGVVLWVAIKQLTILVRVLGYAFRFWIGVIKVAVGVIKGLINGAQDAAKFLGRLATTIKDKLSNAFKDAVDRAKKLVEGFKQLGGDIITAVVDGIKAAPGKILDALKSMLPGGAVGRKLAGTLGFQHGGVVLPGQRVQLVGERGPELATFRPGTRITPLGSGTLPKIRGGAGGGGGDIVVPVYLNGREIARAVGKDTGDQRARRGW